METKTPSTGRQLGRFFAGLGMLAGAYFTVELLACWLLKPVGFTGLAFGALWAAMLSALVLCLPRKAARIVFGVTYYLYTVWAIAQIGYYQIFDKMMWVSTVSYANEGARFFSDVLPAFSATWWIGGIFCLLLGVPIIWFFPKMHKGLLWRIPLLGTAAAMILGLCVLPELVFQRDLGVWGTRSEYGQSSSWRATYNTMYNAKRVYDICGIYQLTFRDIWVNEIYPLTPGYVHTQNEQIQQISDYFEDRGDSNTPNKMTGLFEGKNVVYVLMESMDDWMITQEDTPTLCRLMAEGINFTNFYTPGYGTARTLNSEFCMNTGIYLPTSGSYLFDYVTNSFDQSIASQMTAGGYTSQVFHYNDPDFYSRGVLEPAMGYLAYNCYEDYVEDEDLLFDENLLFDLPEMNDLFFREGQTFNTIITRSAHLSYKYNEVLSHYGLKVYPQYRGLYGSEEEDCARLKAKLVDDMFARLLQELEEKGELENTVIIGMTDHYTYGYKNMEELYALSGVDDELLLEKTPCFIWSANGPRMEVDKTVCTADLVPTVLNLVGIDSPYHYLGQDAFDPNYQGYALFPDGSWVTRGIVCKMGDTEPMILENPKSIAVTDEMYQKMALMTEDFIRVNNLLLQCNYYNKVRN